MYGQVPRTSSDFVRDRRIEKKRRIGKNKSVTYFSILPRSSSLPWLEGVSRATA